MHFDLNVYCPGFVLAASLEDSPILPSPINHRKYFRPSSVVLHYQSALFFHHHLNSPYLVSTYRDCLTLPSETD